MQRRVTASFIVALVVLVLGFTFAATSIANYLAVKHSTIGSDLRPTILCAGLIGLNVVSYAVWLSRWNVVAHTQLMFSIVAYVLPIYFLHSLDGLSSDALDTYYKVIAVGFLTCLIGTLAGAALASPATSERIAGARDFAAGFTAARVEQRTWRLTFWSAVVVVLCFAGMGFAPALTSDPLTAKFFRGAYAAPYAHFAVPYRFATTALTLILPVAAMYAWKRHNLGWTIAASAGAGVMLLGLLRQPAVSGLLLLIGVVLAVRGRGMLLYFAVLAGAYFTGGALYSILNSLGVGGFAAAPGNPHGFIAQVAAGAPDINDQLTFMTHWLSGPQYTHGRTFVGGLVPSNYYWNPSVWSLHVVNPGVPIQDINSGGLRLPAPIWGLVSFGWPGVVGVSFLNGLGTGYLAALFSRIIPSRSAVISTCWLVLYVALVGVIPVFFRLSYLAILEVAVIWWLLFYRTRAPSRVPRLNAARSPDRRTTTARR